MPNDDYRQGYIRGYRLTPEVEHEIERREEMRRFYELKAGIWEYNRSLLYVSMIRMGIAAVPIGILSFLIRDLRTEVISLVAIFGAYLAIEILWQRRALRDARLALDVTTPAPRGND